MRKSAFASMAVAVVALISMVSGAAAYERPAIWTGIYAGVHVGGTNLESSIPGSAIDDTGFTIGGHIGYNYQMGSLVAGVESDIAYLEMNGSDIYQGGLRGRLGFAASHTLFYLTGGLAFIGDRDVSETGWVIGGGVEHMFTANLIGRIEGLYARFDDFDNSGVDISTTTIRAGLSYKF